MFEYVTRNNRVVCLGLGVVSDKTDRIGNKSLCQTMCVLAGHLLLGYVALSNTIGTTILVSWGYIKSLQLTWKWDRVITWTNADLLSIGPVGTNDIFIHENAVENVYLWISSACARFSSELQWLYKDERTPVFGLLTARGKLIVKQVYCHPSIVRL